jgi:hypothetical protein
MTFKEIIDLEPAKVSRFAALEAIHELGEEARRKADTLRESPDAQNNEQRLMIRWFDDIAEMAERKLETVNDTSVAGYCLSMNN